MNAYPAWCGGCWRVCPGRDEMNFCNDAQPDARNPMPWRNKPMIAESEVQQNRNEASIPGGDYHAFLANKLVTAPSVGFEVSESELPSALFPWQTRIVQWACRRGRAALFLDTGLGKTVQQLAWAEQVYRRLLHPVLILAPLAVSRQTQREGERFGIPVHVCRSQDDVKPGLNVTNYERLESFDPGAFGGLVLDESSRLKGDGPLRKGVCAFADPIPYRLAATATPAPNDTEELINHAEFLGIMRGTEILALFFAQDGNTTHKWRLKGHARQAFWKWMASWAVALRKPSDLGYSDEGFELPELRMHQHVVEAPMPQDALFQAEATGIQDQRRVRRETLADRVALAASLVNGSEDLWVFWCDLNAESEALAAAIPGAVEITGSDPHEKKEKALIDFSEGRIKRLVTKAGIAGFGLNWQHCHHTAVVGLGNSYEQYYQLLRRFWRFGQKNDVEAHIITSEADGPIVRNIERKAEQAREMMDQLIQQVGSLDTVGATRETMEYTEETARGRDWTLYLGDCVEKMREIETESVGLSVFSPPFPSMYSYTNSPRDMGNAADFDEMLRHFEFLIPELFRVTKPGRSCAVHLTQALAFLSKDGYCGLKDFRGATIEAMKRHGWIHYGEVTIDKDPQLKAIRTKDRGLLFKTLANDSSHMRMALADYLLQFRKPGDNAEPIRAGISDKYNNRNGWITQEEWIRWARPVWYARDWAPDGDGIAETDVLNVSQARETDDERHLCPLQLGVIERALKLWSNPGDLILSPFAGIGSEGYQALRFGRRFVGIELKASYHRSAVANLQRAEFESAQPTLFDLMETTND